VDVLVSEQLYGAFCELQTKHKRGKPIRGIKQKEELLITWLRKRGYDVDEKTSKMVRFIKITASFYGAIGSKSIPPALSRRLPCPLEEVEQVRRPRRG